MLDEMKTEMGSALVLSKRVMHQVLQAKEEDLDGQEKWRQQCCKDFYNHASQGFSQSVVPLTAAQPGSLISTTSRSRFWPPG